MHSCEFAMTITALACNIAQDKSQEEIALYAALFSQLGDTLATIAAHRELCLPKNTADDQPATQTSKTAAADSGMTQSTEVNKTKSEDDIKRKTAYHDKTKSNDQGMSDTGDKDMSKSNANNSAQDVSQTYPWNEKNNGNP